MSYFPVMRDGSRLARPITHLFLILKGGFMAQFGDGGSISRTAFHFPRTVTEKSLRALKSALLMPVLLSVLSSACATVGTAPEAQKQGDLRIIQNVPFFPQEDYQCGPASLASMLNYRGVSVTPAEVAKAIYSKSAKGTLNIDMALYAHSRGLEASQYKGGPDDLREKIDSDQPLIVLVDYGFSVFQVNHFMVVIGYGEEGVVANSGREEKKFIPLSDFMKSWKKTGYWTLLVKRKT